jgi:hypothetical protein
MRLSPISLLVAVILLFSAPHSILAQVSTTFDSDLEGWQVTGDNSVTWEGTTGNPGGCLSVNDWATGELNVAVASLAYLGDWSDMTDLDSLSVEIFHSSSDPDDYPPDYIFRIEGPGGSAYALSGSGYQPVKDTWNRYVVAIDSSDWTIEAGTWAEILGEVNSLRVWGEFTSGDEICRIDNVNLTATPSDVYNPCVYDDFNGADAGDWSFVDLDGTTHRSSDGNGGGFVEIDDGTGISTALVPPKFLGDWSNLDNNGYITFDLRVISRSSTDLGVGELIRISGPGGSARIDFDPQDLPQGSLTWMQVSYPIDSGTWIVESGTWADLVSYVTECRITLEFFDGSETIGFDNFGRQEDSCPPIDIPVHIHDPNVSYRGYAGLLHIASVAHNSVDNYLYGVIPRSTTGGGGLYHVTSPSSGVRIQAYYRPTHLIFDTDGDCFITEVYDGEVHRMEWGGTSSLWISEFLGGADDDPVGMAFAPGAFVGPDVNPGDILVADKGSGSGACDCVFAFSPDSTEGERQILPDSGDFDFYDIAARVDSTVYLCDALNTNGLYTLDALGTLTPVTINGSIDAICSVVYDHMTDDIYVACSTGLSVHRIEPATGDVTLVADGFAAFEPCCLEIDAANRTLWVADYGYGRVYDLDLGALTAVGDPYPRKPRSRLLGAWPNPFDSSVTIRFGLDHASNVRLDVFDVSGRRVQTLIEGRRGIGDQEISWDGRNASREPLPPGIYFIRMTDGEHTEIVKTVLIRR